MSTYAATSYTLAAMVAAFVLSSWRFKSPELSMVVTALVGALVAGLGFPAHLFVEHLHLPRPGVHLHHGVRLRERLLGGGRRNALVRASSPTGGNDC
jgi:hypothetical protein